MSNICEHYNLKYHFNFSGIKWGNNYSEIVCNIYQLINFDKVNLSEKYVEIEFTVDKNIKQLSLLEDVGFVVKKGNKCKVFFKKNLTVLFRLNPDAVKLDFMLIANFLKKEKKINKWLIIKIFEFMV